MSDPFAEAAADILADPAVGVSAVYTPAGGTEQSVHVVVSEDANPVGEFGQVIDKNVLVFILRADVDQPKRGDTITIDDEDSPHHGTTFTAREVTDRSAYLTQVSVDG